MVTINRERKVEISLPRWEMNNLSEGYKRDVDKIGVVWQISDFSARNRDFGPKKKRSPLNCNHVLATTRKSCSKKKVTFSQINISLIRNFGCFFGLKCIFSQKTLFG